MSENYISRCIYGQERETEEFNGFGIFIPEVDEWLPYSDSVYW